MNSQMKRIWFNSEVRLWKLSSVMEVEFYMYVNHIALSKALPIFDAASNQNL